MTVICTAEIGRGFTYGFIATNVNYQNRVMLLSSPPHSFILKRKAGLLNWVLNHEILWSKTNKYHKRPFS